MMTIPPRDQGNSKGAGHLDVAALLAATRALRDHQAFDEAAKAVLAAGKSTLGAEASLVTLCSPNGEDTEVVFLDGGDLKLDVAAGLAGPLRSLSARACQTGRSVVVNDLLEKSTQVVFESALFAPISLGNDVAGLVGLLNKPGGFSGANRQLVEVFAEMIAVALLRSRASASFDRHRTDLEGQIRDGASQLLKAEKKFRALVENSLDTIARFDPELRHLFVSSAGLRGMTGEPSRELVGKTNHEIGLPTELVEPWNAALRRCFETGKSESLELVFPVGVSARFFDCRILPEPDASGAITSILSVSRDVTDLRLAYEAEQRARVVAEALREATIALTRSLNRETVLTTLLERLRRVVTFDRASVMLLDETSRVSVRAVFDGDRVVPLSGELRSEFDPADHPIVNEVLTTGSAVLIPDLGARPDWKLPTDFAAEASWMGVPLFARGEVAGLFSLSKREPHYFKDEHVKLAEAMSSQASVAVENAVLFEQMQASTVRMQLLSRRLVEAQESERRNIARELHDEAGQALASLRFGLRLLEREIADGGSITGRVAELMHRTDEVIDGLHRLAADLRPASLDHLGLEAALRQYTGSVASKVGLELRFKARGFSAERLPAVIETALYRVVQEAMTNVVRHAQATRVDVLVECRGERVIVVIEDNGVGFDPEQVQTGDHIGLLGMRERADALGGTLTLESSLGAGTTIVVEVASADPHPDR